MSWVLKNKAGFFLFFFIFSFFINKSSEETKTNNGLILLRIVLASVPLQPCVIAGVTQTYSYIGRHI